MKRSFETQDEEFMLIKLQSLVKKIMMKWIQYFLTCIIYSTIILVAS